MEIYKQWVENGRPECEPHSWVKEYYLGSKTGDKVCTKCGCNLVNGRVVDQ